jgi:hypothetical protein
MTVLTPFLHCVLVEAQSLHMKIPTLVEHIFKNFNISGPHGTLPKKCNSGPQ